MVSAYLWMPLYYNGIHTYARRGEANFASRMLGEARRGAPRLTYVCMVLPVRAERRRFKVIKTVEFLIEMNINYHLLYSDWLSLASITRAWRNTIVFIAASPRLAYVCILLFQYDRIAQSDKRCHAAPPHVALPDNANIRIACITLSQRIPAP